VSSADASSGPRHRGRFAPSPTGPLHFGSLVAALASYCDARAGGGDWIVRIEDVDEPRTHRGAEAAILSTLERYGFAWDGAIVRQRERSDAYAAALAQLVAAGHAYECACTRRELDGAPAGIGGERAYPGTCRGGIATDRRDRPRAWRMCVDSERIGFRDRVQGVQAQDLARDVGDFVLRRTDGLYAYQLAVVVDDAAQGITTVVRGADLLASTPRQILLQRCLGQQTPSYLHVPVAIDASGEKLSKQTRAPPLPPDPLPALLAAWRFLGQAEPSGSPGPATLAEFWSWAFARWNVGRVPPVRMLPTPPAPRASPGGRV
jgi:glutamyl-Q tRNA(Asp) synthetase